MTWHYVAAREQGSSPDEYHYTVREFFDKYGYTTDPIKPHGETLSELIVTLERMLADVRAYPVIDEETREEVTECASKISTTA